MHWKVRRDPFYSKLPASQIETAGFFYDSSGADVNVLDTLDTMSTPLHFMKAAVLKARKPAVLLGVGCFAPIHHGHISMMCAAREELIKNGFDAVYGFISPDHDEYVQTKTADPAYAIDERIIQINRAVGHLDWLRVDPWAGLFCDGAVNFTDIVVRLTAYIQKHVRDVPVFLVAGGDNARFALTFQSEGYCVMVGRPGHEGECNKYNSLADGHRIFRANCAVNMSSTTSRIWNPATARTKKDLILRVSMNSGEEIRLGEVLKPYFKSVKFVSIAQQQRKFSEVKAPTISLDPMIKGTFNLEMSRAYDYFGMHRLGYTARPGAKSLEKQIEDISAGEYVLYDDDSFTGLTMQHAARMLEAKPGIKIVDRLTYVTAKDSSEVLDARDFINGANEGGLVIKQLDGSYQRRPYVAPWVNSAIRASVLDSRAFSLTMKEFNR